MDANALVGILMFALVALLALHYFLRPFYQRDFARKKLTEDAKQNRIDEQAAEYLAQKYNKKGRL